MSYQLQDDWNDMVDWDACFDAPILASAGMGPPEVCKGFGFPNFDIQTAFNNGFPDAPAFDNGPMDVPNVDESMTRDNVSMPNLCSPSSNSIGVPCNGCGEHFRYVWLLEYHTRNTGHLSFGCRKDACKEAFITREERNIHEATPHVLGHSRVQHNGPFHCSQCNDTLPSKAGLLRHAQEMQHRPYRCECGGLFSRLDVLNRHLNSFGTDIPEYPCQYCRRHRGENGFRRYDHLLQHVRNYHHHEIDDVLAVTTNATATKSRLKYIFPVCSQVSCPKYRGPDFQQLPRSAKEAGKPFASQSEYTKHMREEHDQCPFNCEIAGCGRTGRRGYFREKDLIKHRQEQHPEATPYLAIKRETQIVCAEPGCNSLLMPSSMFWHYLFHHHEGGDVQAVQQTLMLGNS